MGGVGEAALQAQLKLLRLAQSRGWTSEEIDSILDVLFYWRSKL
jgi:hypothetical protein